MRDSPRLPATIPLLLQLRPFPQGVSPGSIELSSGGFCNSGFKSGASKNLSLLSVIWDTLTARGVIQLQYRIPH